MTELCKPLEHSSEYKALAQGVLSGRLPLAVVGLSMIHKAHVIYSLTQTLGKKAVIVAPDEGEAFRLTDTLTSLGAKPLFFPAREFTFRRIENKSHETEHQRLEVLFSMMAGEYDIVVTCPDAALQFLPDKESLQSGLLSVKAGQSYPIDKALSDLVRLGYSRCEQVEGIGQFSLRGGILDIYPPKSQPVRLEYWGNDIDTLSFFDYKTQRRTEQVESVILTPAREVLPSPALPKKIAEHSAALRGKHAAEIRSILEQDMEALSQGAPLPCIDKYLSLIYKRTTLTDYAGDALLFVSEMSGVKERIRSFSWQLSEDIKTLLSEHVLSKGLTDFALDFTDFTSILENKGAVYLDTFARGYYDTKILENIHIHTKKLSVISTLANLTEELAWYKENGYQTAVVTGNEKTARNLCEALTGEGFSVSYSALEKGAVGVYPTALSGGFSYPDCKFAVLSFGRAASMGKQSQKAPKKKRKGEEIRNLSDLVIGDYVVHNTHGFGIFEGIHKIEMHGIVKDYIKIRYAKSDMLHVPVTQLDLVSKYIGPRDDVHLKLHRLGGQEWQKTKARVRSAVKDIARELIALYSARMKTEGFAFFEDDEFQRDFEARFEFDETDDQLKCIEEIKYDMQRVVPMDRLLCGDVGFGKTEVALRAAFKCVSAGKQCAILVPTTILAWQHYQTILSRMEGFPLKVDLLSRFRSPKQQTQIIKELQKGKIDLLVGTHRLVSKDVQFKDLGLVVIDEEQRFGVAQKERLKDAFQTVDVLTLSATPIPRTLNMALSGIRDMSVIEEAPSDRHPVETYVLEQDNGILYDAIKKELRRGGQCYYLHNRVESIDSTAARLHSALPDARIGVAHGKMSEEELSDIWRKLLEQDIDVLVCTTIIETGVDVPNVNTLIIENADRMGLSQLHQIRGRVGRSSRRAYAYLTFTRGKVLTDVASKRLEAIREFTEFGSGFKIAMRDMEIRGAGNVLGGEQSGHMEQVGYDLYLKLLGEAVLEEKGERKPSEDKECLIDLQINAHIPEEYIPSLTQRIDMYKRVAALEGPEDVSDILDEFIDRFGDPPASVTGLIDVALLRNLSMACGIYEVSQRNNSFLLYVKTIDMKAVSALVSAYKGRVMLNAGAKPYIAVREKPKTAPAQDLTEVLQSLRSNMQSE